ncbi:MAG: hypothetical protein IJ038_05295 [Clostridia bacterium]|nr:hypothetical protein [Clostridia bacterium]
MEPNDNSIENGTVPEETLEVVSDTESEENIEAEAEIDDADALRREIAELKSVIERKERESARMLSEIGEFSELFPESTLESVPEDVWDKVRDGVPLAAAYALYEKKTDARKKIVGAVNDRNAERSSGSISQSRDDLYYSPDEVRKMSASEVKRKYDIIIESMKKWN